MSNHANGTLPQPTTAEPQAPTIDQLLAEGHARLRRVNGDLVFVGNLIDTLVQEIVAREKKIKDLRDEVLPMEKDN